MAKIHARAGPRNRFFFPNLAPRAVLLADEGRGPGEEISVE